MEMYKMDYDKVTKLTSVNYEGIPKGDYVEIDEEGALAIISDLLYEIENYEEQIDDLNGEIEDLEENQRPYDPYEYNGVRETDFF